MMEKVNGSIQPWELLQPNRLVACVVDQCPVLAEAFGRAANAHLQTPDDPWYRTTAFDEHVPGDRLKPYASRKAMVLGYCLQ